MNGSSRRWFQVVAVSRGALVSHLASGCRWIALPALVIACQARVEVGHSRNPVECVDCEVEEEPTQVSPALPTPPEIPSATPDVPVPPSPPTAIEPSVMPALPVPPTAPEDCEEYGYTARDTYDAWLAANNDFGDLDGATFVGYIEGGSDLTLTINNDGSAALVVDEAAGPPVADEGYLCEQTILDGLSCDLTSVVSGGTYPLHGATLTDGRLKAAVPVAAAFDDWCALQTPIYWGDGCYYSVDSPLGYSFSDDYCTIDGEEVDCAWMLLTKSYLCACTDAECFAGNSLDAAGLDLRLSDDGTELTGSLLAHDVYFERQP